MSEPADEGSVLALIEAELQADDPGLTALFDTFARHAARPAAAHWPAADREHWKALAKSSFAVLLVPLALMTVLVALSSIRGAASRRPSCPPPAALAHPQLAGIVGCPAAGQARGSAPGPGNVRSPARTGDGASALIAHTYEDVAVLGRQTVTAMAMWAAREGQAIRAQICLSIPLPAGAACR
jgi:hypothetical protein